jgi:hypothetical protein
MIRLRAILPLALLACLAATTPADAGPNAGFAVSVAPPLRIENPVVGETITLQLLASGTTEVKGIVARVYYDPAVVAVRSYSVGDMTPGAIALTKSLDSRNGLSGTEAGSTILGSQTVATTGGVLGTLQFDVVGELGDTGSGIWVSYVEVNTSSDVADKDTLAFDDGDLGVSLVRRFANRIFNADVTRRFDGATVSWESRFPGLVDTLRVRASGDSLWRVATAQRVADFAVNVRTAARALLAAGVTIDSTNTAPMDAILDSLGLGAPYEAGFLASLVRLNRLLLSRRHVVSIDGLSADTQYEYQARSVSLRGEASNRLSGLFRTRQAQDLRPVAGTDLDLQATTTTATATWFTNRLSTSQLTIYDLDSLEVASATLDPEGTLVHAVTLGDLQPGTEYLFDIRSRLIEADTLVAQGLLTESQVVVVKSGRFRTLAARRPLRLLTPPSRVVSPETAVINVRLNQIALATVAYGEAAGVSPDSAGVTLYTESTSTGDILTEHSITLADLSPSTRYRFRLTVVTPDGDSLTTDPRGNQQWSRDLTFTTSAAGDTLPPVIVEGPAVVVRDVLAVVRFTTDVDTRATLFFGTRDGTYGTADEFEVPDQTADGSLRLAQEHAIVVSGLEPGVVYDYGIVVESTNGQTASFEPNLPASKPLRAGKRLRVLQPPGGAGSFTTTNDPDTQYPVILSGPTVTSKSHNTAIVEWTTDEPATSDVSFGTEAIGETRASSGVSKTKHKIVLSNLAEGTGYLFEAQSIDAAGNGATISDAGTFTTDPEIDLAAPQITSAPAVTYKNDEAATIRWTTDEDATGQIDFGTAADDLGFIRTLATTGRTHEVTLTNLSPSTTYHYAVSSSDLSNNGPTISDTLSFTTDATADVTPPAISNVQVTALDSLAIVTWTTDELGDSFVDLGVVSGVLDETVGDAADVLEHEITLTNLTPGTQYFLTVGSSDRVGNGPVESEEIAFTTLAAADTTAPSTPAGVDGTAGSQTTSLTWTANTEADLAGYTLYRRRGEAAFTPIATLLAQPSYTDRGLTNDTAYDYRVSAVDRSGNESAPSADLSLTPTLSAAPTAPTGLQASGSSLQPTFTFANAEPFLTGTPLSYTIQVSTQVDFSDVTASTSGLAEGLGTTSWTLPRTLENGTTYYWRVRAVEGLLAGPFSETREHVATLGPALAGDFDDSGAVDFDDFFAFVDAFGRPVDEVPYFDMDGSGPGTAIDFDDFFAFVDAFGSSSGKPAASAAVRAVDETARLRLTAELLDGRQRVHLDLAADEWTDVRAWGVSLSWDPTLLAFESAAGPQQDGPDLFRVLQRQPGRLLLGDGSTGGQAPGDRQLTPADLASLEFVLKDRRRVNEVRVDLQQALLAGTDGVVRRAPAVAAARVRPAAFVLGQAYPNPFNPSTQIDFALAAESPASLVVYDVLGRRVRTLLRDAARPAGFYSVRWDGRDSDGRPVGSGVYFYRLSTPSVTQTGKMLLLE